MKLFSNSAVPWLAIVCLGLGQMRVAWAQPRWSVREPVEEDLQKWPGCKNTPDFERWLQSFHSVKQPWQLASSDMESDESCVRIHDIVELLLRSPREPSILPLAELCHKPMHQRGNTGLEDPTGSYCHDPEFETMREDRWNAACPLVPGIAADGALNPCGVRYRMLDGRHRICKLKMDSMMKVTHVPFFILNKTEILSLVTNNCDLDDDDDDFPTRLNWQDFEIAWQGTVSDRKVDPAVLHFVRASQPKVLQERAVEEL
ncbi:unnamed protein product [Symbiodinium sp. CCMP2592]|nr:unnamed protein product [Symbiodinium sp. CCMP2592]